MFCTNCGIWIKKGMKECPLCGTPAYMGLMDDRSEDKLWLFYIMLSKTGVKGVSKVSVFNDLASLKASAEYKSWKEENS